MKEEPICRYLHAHEAVVANEYWYGDGPPHLKASFSAAKTAERQAEVIVFWRVPRPRTRLTHFLFNNRNAIC